MAETLAAMEENPLEKYLEDETGIVEKVQKFLDGEMFNELHNRVMDYGAVTIEPKATSTSSISTSGDSAITGGTGSSGDSSSSSSSNSSSGGNSGSTRKEPYQPSARAIASHRKSDAARIYDQNMAPLRAAWNWFIGG